MKKKESLEEMVTRRNRRLVSVFTRNGMNVRVVGDPEKPAVIKDEDTVLSCFVKNFNLFFTREPFSDDIVKTIKLKHDPEINRFELQQILDSCRHRHVYKLRLLGTDLYLAGYNYINSEDSVGRYPVFARHKPKVYFDRNYADKIAKNLIQDGYQLDII